MEETTMPGRSGYAKPGRQPAAGGFAGARPARITQAELESYAELLDLEEEVEGMKEELRVGLIARLEANAPVEPGRLRPSISRGMRREFNGKVLETIFGRDWVERTKAELPAREVTSLRLLGRGERRRSSGRGRA